LRHRWLDAAMAVVGSAAARPVLLRSDCAVRKRPGPRRARAAVRGSSSTAIRFCHAHPRSARTIRGSLIGFTSAALRRPGREGRRRRRRGPRCCSAPWWRANEGLDYARSSSSTPHLVQPVAEVNGFRIDGIGPDPVFGGCRRASWAAHHRLLVWRDVGPGEKPGTIVNQVCGQPGDSGAPVHGEQPARRDDPRRVQRGPPHLRGQVRAAAHPGSHGVDQLRFSPTSPAKKPAGHRLRSGPRGLPSGPPLLYWP